MAVIVIALLRVYTLPGPVKRSMAFEYATPTVGTAYTAHFVHFTPSHLAGNLAAFLLVGGVLIALSVRGRDPWLLVGVVVTLTVVVPVSLSFLNLAVPRNGVMYGFSGVNMVMVGFLPVAVVRYAESRRSRSIDPSGLLAAFFFSVGYVAWTVAPQSTRSVAVIAVSIGLAILLAGKTHRIERKAPRTRAFRRSDPLLVVGTAA